MDRKRPYQATEHTSKGYQQPTSKRVCRFSGHIFRKQMATAKCKTRPTRKAEHSTRSAESTRATRERRSGLRKVKSRRPPWLWA